MRSVNYWDRIGHLAKNVKTIWVRKLMSHTLALASSAAKSAKLAAYRRCLHACALLASIFLMTEFTALAQSSVAPEQLALAVVDDLAHKRFAAAVARFTPEMNKALPEKALEAIWDKLLAVAGDAKEVGIPHKAEQGRFILVVVPVKFEKMAIDVRIAFENDRVAGLFFTPAQASPAAWSPPAYVDRSRFDAVEVKIGEPPLTLPGTLTLPKTGTKHPALILVHGSGPQDREETIGANRPFRDLAEGLSSAGLVVLRYEKRSKAYPGEFAASKSFTVREEVIDDAVAAVKVLRARPEVDPAKIFVLGHSLGGTLVPRIIGAEPTLAGGIMLAAAARPIPELIVEQIEYLASLAGPLDEAGKLQIAELKAEVARALAAKPDGQQQPILGMPAAYWADLNAYDPAAATQKLTTPLLILQGGRDYQVTFKDLERFKSALAGRTNAEIREFPGLNHLFMPGEGKSTPDEYQRPGHVDPPVIQAIVTFVKGLS